MNINLSPHSTNQNGRTVLHHALLDGIERGDTHITNQLLAFGADVMIRDEVSRLFLFLNFFSIFMFSIFKRFSSPEINKKITD